MSKRALIGLTLPALALLTTGCVGFDFLDEQEDCAHEESTEPALETSVPPDFEIEVTFDIPEQQEPWEDGGKHLIQVWDCLDLSWWTSAEPRKVVQIYVDETECELYEAVYLEYYDCYSHEGPDSPWRDWDGDGLTADAGDPDDEDPDVPYAADTGGTDTGRTLSF